MVMKLSRTVLIALLLGVAMGSTSQETTKNTPVNALSTAVGCHKYTCITSTQTFSTGTCAYYDIDNDFYYLDKCQGGTVCQPSGTSQNWTCVTPATPASPTYYPGEKCTANADCNAFSSGCGSDNVCMGKANGANCTSSAQCVPGSSCQRVDGTYVCSTLIGIDKLGCAADTDCVYNAGCNITSTTTPTENYCRTYLTIQPGARIATAACVGNQNMLCSSGYCSNMGGGVEYFCSEPFKSQSSIPTACLDTTSTDCISNKDEKTGYFIQGTCDCAKNKNGDGYCSLNPADTPIQNFHNQVMSWLNSAAVKKCNTERRLYPDNLACATNYWTKSSVNAMVYYNLVSTYYVAMQGSEQCVLDVFYTDYETAKANYDHTSGATQLIAASVFLVALFA